MSDHLNDEVRNAFPNGVAGNMVGYLENVRMETIDAKECMVADLQVTDPKMREVFKNLGEQGRLDKLGFSIDVEGAISQGREVAGMTVERVEAINKAYSLDVVTYPAAGGRTLSIQASYKGKSIKGISDFRLGEAAKILGVSTASLLDLIPQERLAKETIKMKNKILAFVKAFLPESIKGLKVEDITDAQLSEAAVKAVESLMGKLKKEPVKEAEVSEALDGKLKKALELMKEGKMDEAMEMISSALADLAMSGSAYRAPAAEAKGEGDEAAKAEAAKAAEAKKVEEAKKAKEAEDTKKAEAAKAAKAKSATESANAEEISNLKKTVEEQGKQLKESQTEKSEAVLTRKLAESGLPMPLREEIAAEMKGRIFTEADAEKRVNKAKDLAAKLSESGNIRGMGTPAASVKVGMTEADYVQLRMDLTVDPELAKLKESKDKYKGVKPFRGLREAWGTVTGDWDARFDRRRAMESGRMYEAVTTDFPRVLGDSITRHLLRRYKGFPDKWRQAVSVKPLNDFRTQRPIQWGTFANLATVAEDAAFGSLANPSEREATYAPAKRGGLFAITREMILQDDLRKLRDLGPMLSRAAVRTLNQFVFNILVGNVGGGGVNTDILSYQAGVTFTLANANLGTDALDADSLRAARIRMRLQQDDDTNETLGLRSKFLWVPLELEPTAEVLVNSEKKPGSADNDVNDNFKSVTVMGIPYIGDVNDWFLQAEQNDLESIELGFVEGEEDPQVLIQDDPRVGDVFSRERITYKVRHEYGGTITNHRGVDGNIVP